ncbi:MAG TPA: glycosyltransferase family 2 protein [Anaerolineales bacterium]|nr:glycosyltransferase family 2 protein [Anaerolineales bacterium]
MPSDPELPLVSIITPSYNQAAFLEDSLGSVLAQDYPAIEYLVVDGGSQDGSLEIIQRHADRLAWWVTEPDAGQAQAINKGMARARGEVVGWLNSDDLYLPGAIRGAVTALQSQPQAGLVYADAVSIDSQGNPLNTLAFPDWGLEELMGFRIICQPAAFMRRTALEQAGYLDESYQFLLDHHLWLRLAGRAPIIHVPALWAAARQHPEAKNVAQAGGFGREAFRILDWMQTQPELAPLLVKNRRRVLAGVNRLNARYLLDGGLPGPALRAYGRALSLWPGFALLHWRRMLFAAFSVLAGESTTRRFLNVNRSRQMRAARGLANLPGIRSWPGITLENFGKNPTG